MGEKDSRYELKGNRPRKAINLRLSEKEEKSLARIQREGETPQSAIRRLIKERTMSNVLDMTGVTTVSIGGQYFHCIEDKFGVDCFYPLDGSGSLEDVVAENGDELSAICQYATFYRSHSGDGASSPITDWHGQPYIENGQGFWPAKTGDKWEDPNGEDLIATEDGWEPAEKADVHTYGAKI